MDMLFPFLMIIFEMPETVPGILDLLIQSTLLILIIVFIFVGMRLLRFLGVAQEIAESVGDIVEMVNTVLWQPVKIGYMLLDKVKSFFGR